MFKFLITLTTRVNTLQIAKIDAQECNDDKAFAFLREIVEEGFPNEEMIEKINYVFEKP